MSLPEIEIADILSADSGLVSLMASLRQSKLDYIPIFTKTPDDTFIKKLLCSLDSRHADSGR